MSTINIVIVALIEAFVTLFHAAEAYAQFVLNPAFEPVSIFVNAAVIADLVVAYVIKKENIIGDVVDLLN